MRRSVQLDFDQSNNSIYGWVAFIGWLKLDVIDYDIDLYVFPTLGHAQQFYVPFIQGEWKQDDPGGRWEADLKQPCVMSKGHRAKAVRVQLRQLLYIGDEDCSSEADVKLGEKS